MSRTDSIKVTAPLLQLQEVLDLLKNQGEHLENLLDFTAIHL